MERAHKTIETRITELEAKKAQYQAKIDNYKKKISALEVKVQELSDSRKQKDIENLLKVIKASGKTPEQVIAALKTDEVI